MEVRIRQLQSLDAALVLEGDLRTYLNQVISEYRDTPPPPGAAKGLLQRALGAPEGLVLTAIDRTGDRRRGFCVTAPFVDPIVGDSRPLIAALYVDPSVRHRGLARQLVEAASDTLAMRGFTRVAAIAGHNDDALISMGERWGFVRQWELLLRE